MKDIVTYITEGGFFKNTGADKYIDIIKNFGDIIATEIAQKEFKTARWLSLIPETKIYKKLYDLFNDINKYEVKFDLVYSTSVSISGAPDIDICTEHWIGVRNGNEFNISFDRTYEKQPGEIEKNRSNLIKCKDASEFLSRILYYMRGALNHPDILRTAKFTIK